MSEPEGGAQRGHGALPEGGALPEWPVGTVGLLIAAGPHAIPVSTAVRAGDDRLVFGLARRRRTLAHLREDPRAAFALLAEGVAFTAYGEVRVVREQLERVPPVAALELRVERLQDHLAEGRTEMLAAARWRWAVEEAKDADRAVVAEIAALADG
jgi:Pyridoxamine 5'-phosphate oxidase